MFSSRIFSSRLFPFPIAVCVALTLAGLAPAQDGEPLPFHDITGITAPAPLPWAQPLADGAVDILAIAPYATLGDIAMLRGHLECDVETVATWDRDHLGYDPLFPEPHFPEARLEAVEERLARQLDRKRLDVIVIGQCEPSMFPESVQRRIIEHVEGGAGLLITGSGLVPGGPLADWILAAEPPPDPPAHHESSGPLGIPRLEQANLISYRTAGEGRIVVVSFPRAALPNHCLIPVPENPYMMNPEHESNAFSLICQALLWAAGREERARVREVVDVAPKGPDDEEIPPGYPREFIEAVRRNAFNQPVRPFVLELEAPAEQHYDVIYQLRVPGANLPAWRVESGTAIPEGEQRCALDIVATPGDYYLDVWLTRRRGVVSWHTEPITVRGWPQISDTAITQNGEEAVWVHPNDYLDLSIHVEPGSFLTTGEEATVYARAVDNLERQVASAFQAVGPEGGRVSLRLELADLLAPLIRVELFAVPSGLVSESGLAGQAARQVYYFPVRLPEPALEPSVILSATGPFDYGAIRRLEQLRDRLDAHTLHAPAGPESLLAAGAAGMQLLAQVGSLDAGHVAGQETRIPCLSSAAFWEREEARVKSGVLAAWAGGPPRYSLGSGVALTDTDANLCQGPDCLERLRANLQQAYPDIQALNRSWGTQFSSWQHVVPVALDQCQRDRQWAPWLDFRRSMSEVLTDTLARGRAAVGSIPGAGKAGFLSPVSPITPVMGYDWQALCATVDFITAPAEPYALRRIQSYHPRRPHSGVILGYAQLREDAAHARWLPWDCLFRQIPAIWIQDPINRGPRSLIAPSGTVRPGLAALAESVESIHGGVGTLLLNAAPHQTGIAFVDSPESRILDHADPEPGRTAEAAETWLDQRLNQLGYAALVRSLSGSLDGINTLILSRDRVLSDRHLVILKAFHDGGGLILSDGRAGIFDHHGRTREIAPLPFLHPMERGSSGDAFALWTNRPVWVSQISASENTMAILGQLLERAGNTPGLPVNLPDKLEGSIARFQYTYGAATIVACLAYPDSATTLRRASLKVPDGHYGYPLVSAEASPSSRRLQWSVTPGKPAVFALLPYEVEDLTILAPEFTLAGERLAFTVQMDSGDAQPGAHCLMVRVLGPSGDEIRHYRRYLTETGGIFEGYIPLAESDAPGYYTLAVRDVLTNTERSVRVEVQ